MRELVEARRPEALDRYRPGCRRLHRSRTSRRRQHGAGRCRPADDGSRGVRPMGQVPARARARAPRGRPMHGLGRGRRPAARSSRASATRTMAASSGLDQRSSRRGRCSHGPRILDTRTAAKARSCSSRTARRYINSNSKTSATSISTSSRRSSPSRPATNSACPSRAAWPPHADHRPARRIPAPIDYSQRRRCSQRARRRARPGDCALGTPGTRAPRILAPRAQGSPAGRWPGGGTPVPHSSRHVGPPTGAACPAPS